MPNKETHFTIAFIALIILYFIMNKLNLFNYFGYATILLIGSVLPDIIEPAVAKKNRKTWEHRQFFHSKRFLKSLYVSLIPLLILGIMFNIILYLFFLVIGYVIHLWLDSTTKMGLPK